MSQTLHEHTDLKVSYNNLSFTIQALCVLFILPLLIKEVSNTEHCLVSIN